MFDSQIKSRAKKRKTLMLFIVKEAKIGNNSREGNIASNKSKILSEQVQVLRMKRKNS